MTVAEQISPCPYTVLRCLWSTVARWSPLLSSSRALVWDGGQVPPRTPGPNKSSLFQHLQGPKATPDHEEHFSFSPGDSSGMTNPALSQFQWRGGSLLLNPFDKRRLKASFSLPAQIAGSQQERLFPLFLSPAILRPLSRSRLLILSYCGGQRLGLVLSFPLHSQGNIKTSSAEEGKEAKIGRKRY